MEVWMKATSTKFGFSNHISENMHDKSHPFHKNLRIPPPTNSAKSETVPTKA